MKKPSLTIPQRWHFDDFWEQYAGRGYQPTTRLLTRRAALKLYREAIEMGKGEKEKAVNLSNFLSRYIKYRQSVLEHIDRRCGEGASEHFVGAEFIDEFLGDMTPEETAQEQSYAAAEMSGG